MIGIDSGYVPVAFPAGMYQPNGKYKVALSQEHKEELEAQGWFDHPDCKAKEPVKPDMATGLNEMSAAIDAADKYLISRMGLFDVAAPVEVLVETPVVAEPFDLSNPALADAVKAMEEKYLPSTPPAEVPVAAPVVPPAVPERFRATPGKPPVK